MIKSWVGKQAAAVWLRRRPRGLDARVVERLQRVLAQLDAAQSLEDLRTPPANRLHKLHGDRAGQYAIRVNDQFRVCFRWRDGDAWDVEFVDYH
jgi:proteic killer suppression protein